MEFIDTHCHFYLNDFDADRDEVLQACITANVNTLLLPNINRDSIEPMLKVCQSYPQHCFPMLGLHPSDVNNHYQEELNYILNQYDPKQYLAIGEVGIDLYWDRTYINQQIMAFRQQIEFAIKHDLPLIIHSRKSFTEILSVLNEYKQTKMKGIFHCFSGDVNQAKKVIEKGFYLGIGGTLTYKNSGIQEVVKQIPLSHLVLETDAPFLPPVPHRGKRNQSNYIPLIAEKISELKGISIEEIAQTTSFNAKSIFKL